MSQEECNREFSPTTKAQTASYFGKGKPFMQTTVRSASSILSWLKPKFAVQETSSIPEMSEHAPGRVVGAAGGDGYGDGGVVLKTLTGLERVAAIFRRVDSDFCGPLEFRGLRAALPLGGQGHAVDQPGDFPLRPDRSGA